MVFPMPKKGASCFHPPGTARWIFREPAGLRAAAASARSRPQPGGDPAGSLHAADPELAAGGSGFGQRLLRPGPNGRPRAVRTPGPGELRLRAPDLPSPRVPDVVSHSKKLSKENEKQLSDMTTLNKQKGDLKALSKEKRGKKKKLEVCRHLFYFLQI